MLDSSGFSKMLKDVNESNILCRFLKHKLNHKQCDYPYLNIQVRVYPSDIKQGMKRNTNIKFDF